MNARDAGRNHVRCLGQQFILIGGTILQLHVAVEQEQRGQQNACTVIFNQRFPRLRGSPYASRRSRIPAELPVVQHQIAFWQTVHLPSLHTAAIPADLRVTERDEP